MNKIAQKMLQHKKGIVALFAVLAVLCALLSRRVKVDYNMMRSFLGISLLPICWMEKTSQPMSLPGPTDIW